MQQNPRILYFWKEIIGLCPQENNEPRRRKSFDLHLITTLALLCFEEAEEVEHQTMIDLLEPQHPVRLHTRNGTRKGYAMEGIQQYMK